MRRNWLEWTVLAMSVVALVALVGFLAFEAVRGTSPADVAVEPRSAEARETEGGWVMPVTIVNRGGEAAAAVQVEATADVGGREESSVIVLDLLPAESEAEAVIGFSQPPAGDVQLRVVGYESP